jgi:hypothetical protein
VANVVMLLTMNGNVWWSEGSLSTQCGIDRSYGSWNSMSSTCKPQDIISLVTPSLRGGNRDHGRHEFRIGPNL